MNENPRVARPAAARLALAFTTMAGIAALTITSGLAASAATARPAPGLAAEAAPAVAAHQDGGARQGAAPGARVWPGPPMLGAGPPGPARPAGSAAGAVGGRRIVTAFNWSGYAVTKRNMRFRSVRATFFVPFLICPKPPRHRTGHRTFSTDWVGLDGFLKKHSVEQAGIEADCGGTSGTRPRYRAWYEMFPRPQTTTSVIVKPGNSVTASVRYESAAGKFRLSLTDNTTGRSFSVLQACPAAVTCLRNSAEVITEAPSRSAGGGPRILQPLADYEAVAFSRIAITDVAGSTGPLTSAAWRATKILQTGINSGSRIARPTAVFRDSFGNYWLGQS